LGSAQAMIAVVDVPWARYGQAQDEIHYILGNDWNDTPNGGGFHLRVDAAKLYSTARTITFKIANDSAQTRTGTLTLTDTMPDTPRQLTICISSDGSDLDLRAYSDGVSVGSVVWDGGLTAFSGTALDGSGFLIGCTGSGSSLALTPFGSGARRGFDGSIEFLGVYNGTVSNANLIIISNGQPPQDVLTTTANWIIGRQPTDYTAAVPAASWATADTRGDWALTGTMLPGGDLTPAYSSGNTFAIEPITDGTVWGMAPNGTDVSVPLSFAASGVTGAVEARLISASDGAVISDWATVTGVNLGTTNSGTITWPECENGWAYVEARPTSSPTMLQRSRSHCAVGWTVALVGQSQVAYSTQLLSGSALTAAGNGNLSYAGRFFDGSATNGALVADRITSAVPRTDGLAAMVGEVSRYGRTPVMILDMSMVGTGPADLQDDSDTDRLWSQSPGLLVDLTSNRVSAFNITWDTSIPYTSLDTSMDALIKGTTSTWTISGTNYLQSSYFHHTTSVGIALQPSIGLGNNLTGLNQEVFGAANSNIDWQYRRLLLEYAGDNGFVVGYDPSASGDLDAGHAITNESKGRMGRTLLASAMKACGVEALAEPTPISTTWASDGTYVDIYVDLPEGGNLTVEGGFTGSPTGEDANPVQGIEFQDIAGTSTSSRSGFTTAIQDSGTGTAPNRRGIIRATKSTGSWGEGTVVTPFRGMPISFQEPTRTHSLWKGYPRERSAAYGGLGLIVPAGVQAFTRPVVPETTLGATHWCDIGASGTCFQERTGASASTEAGDGDPVGTLVISTPSADVYMTAPSDAARPTLTRKTQTIDEVIGDNNTRFNYKTAGAEVWYLNFDGTDDELHASSPYLPDSTQWTFGMAVATNTTSGNRHVVSQADNLPANSGAWALFMNVASNLGVFGSHWRFVWKDASPEIQDPPSIVNVYSGILEEQSLMHVNTSSESRIVSRGNAVVDTYTSASSEGVQQENFCFGQSAQTAMLSHGSFRLYGFFIATDDFTATQQKQALVWLGERYGQINPYW
ncbi:MAG: hypothetical protein AAGB15_07215, partial [Pseudomonadota bacterium]